MELEYVGVEVVRFGFHEAAIGGYRVVEMECFPVVEIHGFHVAVMVQVDLLVEIRGFHVAVNGGLHVAVNGGFLVAEILGLRVVVMV